MSQLWIQLTGSKAANPIQTLPHNSPPFHQHLPCPSRSLILESACAIVPTHYAIVTIETLLECDLVLLRHPISCSFQLHHLLLQTIDTLQSNQQRKRWKCKMNLLQQLLLVCNTLLKSQELLVLHTECSLSGRDTT
jgi:hypothetical protein